jgi:hypothetical protein
LFWLSLLYEEHFPEIFLIQKNIEAFISCEASADLKPVLDQCQKFLAFSIDDGQF